MLYVRRRNRSEDVDQILHLTGAGGSETVRLVASRCMFGPEQVVHTSYREALTIVICTGSGISAPLSLLRSGLSARRLRDGAHVCLSGCLSMGREVAEVFERIPAEDGFAESREDARPVLDSWRRSLRFQAPVSGV